MNQISNNVLDRHIIDTSASLYQDDKKFFQLFKYGSPFLINTECARYMDVGTILESEYRCTLTP